MDNNMYQRDILIIGAGPSGLSTALHLHKHFPHLTPRVLILEKAHHPRPKLCAGGLVIDAEIILERLGLDVSEVPHVNVETARFDFAGKGLQMGGGHPKNGRRLTRNKADEKKDSASLRAAPQTNRPVLRVIRRNEFDAWLLKKAESRGIEIRQGVTVKNIIVRDDRVIVETDLGSFHAQIVVGADGSNGITRRSILPNAPVHTARLLEVITPTQPPPPHLHSLAPPARAGVRQAVSPRWALGPNGVQVSAPPPNTTPKFEFTTEVPISHLREAGREQVAFFDFFPVPDNIAGYVWDFPTLVNGQPMRCWGVYDTNLLADERRPQLKEPLAEEMSRHGFDLSQYELKGHPIRWYSPANPISAPRVLLVGDAAGADPLFGEGISIALGYGAVAAQEIGKSIQCNDFSFNGYKKRLARSGLGQALFIRWATTQVVYSLKWRWFQILLWRVLKPVVMVAGWFLVLNWAKRIR